MSRATSPISGKPYGLRLCAASGSSPARALCQNWDDAERRENQREEEEELE
jgi:hypothetical protein